MPQTVLITGASSGIGRATARLFAQRGAVLVLMARGREALEATAAEVRAEGAADVVVCPADVLDEGALRTAVEGTVQRFGSLDVVVHSAQVVAYGRIEEVPKEVFERVVDTALHGTANLARVVLPQFRRQGEGHLVIVSSLLASVATPLMGSYITAKWGQLGLIRVLQQETRDVPGIHVSAVAPGGVNTPIYSPERVARSIVARLDRPRRLVQSGFANPVVILGFRLFPAVYDALVGPLLRVFALADDQRTPPTAGNVFESRPAGNAEKGRWHGIP